MQLDFRKTDQFTKLVVSKVSGRNNKFISSLFLCQGTRHLRCLLFYVVIVNSVIPIRNNKL